MAKSILQQSGVYVIRNTVSGRVYVGSGVRIGDRWKAHRFLLARGKHHSLVMQRSWDKHGPAAFSFEVLELVQDKSELIAREQHWIDALSAACPLRGFNRSPTAGNVLGVKHSEETRRKQSQKRKGIPKSPAHRAAIGAAQVGKEISAAQRILAAEKTRQYFRDHPEARERMREVGRKNGLAGKGRILSAQARENMSKARIGSPKFRASSIANLGKIDPAAQKLIAAANGRKRKGLPNRQNRSLSFETAQEIRARKAEGWTYDRLVAEYGLDRASLFRLIKGLTYTAP